jgi:hypothetical protein
MCIKSRALSAAIVVMIATAAGGRARAQTSAGSEAEFEPEPDNKTIEPPQSGAPPARERAKKRQPQPPGAPPPAYERAGDGGFAIELSAGGVASGSFQGGILLGLGMRGFVFGLFMDAWQSTTIPAADPSGFDSVGRSTRVGIAARVPMVRTSDGRVSVFAAGDLAIASRYVLVNNAGATSSPHAEGVTWSVGPGLRFWLNDHLSLAYLTRLRWTRLEGAPAALPEVPADWPTVTVSARYTQLEGVFQFLCIF